MIYNNEKFVYRNYIVNLNLCTARRSHGVGTRIQRRAALGLAKKGEGLEEDLDECCIVIYKDGENLNSEGIGRRGKFIYCQYSRSGARFFVFDI